MGTIKTDAFDIVNGKLHIGEIYLEGLPITQALVIIRGQKALKVEKMDYSKHPESSKLRDCKASAHIPEWRKLEEKAQPLSLIHI